MKHEFGWEVLDIIIGGKSSIDSMQGFAISSLGEADRFLVSYGFDLDHPIEKAQAFGNFHEALNFVRKYFLQPENPEGLRLELPRRLLELTDVRELFLLANFSAPGQHKDSQGTMLRNWACSILKVMHTIAHVDQDVRSSYFSDVQQQIFDRYYRAIHRDHEGRLYLGEKTEDPSRVNLVAFETKPKKSRDSLLMKLLHKPENVAEDIFDRIGIRFVTETRLDALEVVQYLKDRMIVIPPNIKPSRSRNTLLDIERFKEKYMELKKAGKLGEQQLREAAATLEGNTDNPHSSEFYRALQFTSRQLIKLKNPLYDDLKEVKGLVKTKVLSDDVIKLIERIDLKYVQREVRFFYPYEVQIVDIVSHEENEKGRSAHKEYKKAQRQTAMRRVMGNLCDAGKS